MKKQCQGTTVNAPDFRLSVVVGTCCFVFSHVSLTLYFPLLLWAWIAPRKPPGGPAPCQVGNKLAGKCISQEPPLTAACYRWGLRKLWRPHHTLPRKRMAKMPDTCGISRCRALVPHSLCSTSEPSRRRDCNGDLVSSTRKNNWCYNNHQRQNLVQSCTMDPARPANIGVEFRAQGHFLSTETGPASPVLDSASRPGLWSATLQENCSNHKYKPRFRHSHRNLLPEISRPKGRHTSTGWPSSAPPSWWTVFVSGIARSWRSSSVSSLMLRFHVDPRLEAPFENPNSHGASAPRWQRWGLELG